MAFLVSVAAIFLYANRRRQRMIVVVAQFVTLIALVALFIGRRSTESLPGAAATTASDWMLLLFPVVSYVLFLLARRAIDRDIKLVESVDRLR